MIIEIHSPNLKANNKILDGIRRKILVLSHLSEQISRAEIFLTEADSLRKENKVFKIRLDIFGDALFVHKNASSFESAATSAVRTLKSLLKQKTERRNEPPDEITSTINV